MKKKGICGIFLAVALIFSCTIPQTVYADSWQHDSHGWWYRYDSGSYPRNQWRYIDGYEYWFDSDGYMATYWKVVDGKWHYFGSDGAEKYGWIKIGSTWYYLNQYGEMQTGWQQIDGTWYLFDGNGAMTTNWKSLYGVWYYFGSSGAMCTGWELINENWYHFNNDGVMDSGWTYVNKEWYYLASDGAMYKEGWHYINGEWYYMYSSGAMAHDTWIGNYYVNTSGAMEDLSQGAYLMDIMKPYDKPSDGWYDEYTSTYFKMSGTEYTKGFICSLDYEEGNAVYFNLGAKFKKLSFTLGIWDGHYFGEDGRLRIFADGKEIASYKVKKGDLPTQHEISVNNCKQLKFTISTDTNFQGSLGVAEIKVYK